MRQGLLVTALCLVVTSCDRGSRNASADTQWIQLEGTRLEYAHKVELTQLKLEKQDSSRPDADKVIAGVDALRAKRAELKAKRDLLQSDLTNGEIAALNSYRTSVEAARAKAVGKEYPLFQTARGRSYENAKVAAVTDDGVKLVHSSGVARLGFSDLTEPQRALFGLDESFESAAQDRQREQELAYHQWMDREIAAEAPKREAELARKTEETKALAKIAAMQPRVTVQASVSPLQRQPDSDTPKYRVRPRRTYYYYPASGYSGYNYRAYSNAYQIYSTPRSAPSISLPGPSYCRPIVTPSPSRTTP